MNSENLELKIAKFLRAGVIFCGCLMFIGWALQVKLSSNPFFTFQTYDKIPFLELVQFYIRRMNIGVLISYAGLFGLISLPIIRVFLIFILFIKSKDYIFAFFSMIVFSVLILSMILGSFE